MKNEEWSAAFLLMAAICVAPHIPEALGIMLAIICLGFAGYAKLRKD